MPTTSKLSRPTINLGHTSGTEPGAVATGYPRKIFPAGLPGRYRSRFRTNTAKLGVPMLLISGLISTAVAQANQSIEKIKILIVYHSRGGHTAEMAKAVAEGAKKNPQAEITLKPVGEVKCAELLATDALIVGSPVYWSNMAGEVKSFFDRWSTECNVLPPAFPMRDKVGGAFVTGGETSSGKEIALMTIVAAMLGNRMIVVSEGQALGAAATTGEGKSPLTEKELGEARRLGERIAQTAARLKRGK